MKLSTAERKSKAGFQTWNKHIDAYNQRLANKRLRREAKKQVADETADKSM
jgi:hypothetical protein